MKPNKKVSKGLSLFLSIPLLFSATIAPTVLPAGQAMAGNYQWTTNGPSANCISAIAVSPNYADDKTIFAAARDLYGTGEGVSKSTNGGASWSNSSDALNYAFVESIAVSPNYALDKTVLTLTSDGLYKTTDGGDSWQLDWQEDNRIVTSVAFSPDYANDKTIFAVIETYGEESGSSGIFKSTDEGANWSPVNAPDTGEVLSIAVSPNFASDKTIFVATGYGICKSTDAGTSWSSPNESPMGFSVAISPNYKNDKTVFVGGDCVYKSTDGGASWNQKNCGDHFIMDVSISPSYASDKTVFIAADNGIFRSTDSGSNWTKISGLLQQNETGNVVVSPDYANDKTVFMGAGYGVYSYTFKNTVLKPNSALTSADGRFKLVYQGDGNLVLYRNSDRKALWSSRTNRTTPGKAVMQSDGNFVVYDASGVARWSSRTQGHPCSRLVVQTDGNAVIYNSSAKALWSTKTQGN